MNCPDEIADLFLEVLYRGAIYARAAAWSEDAKLAALEADHIHNVPHLLKNFTREKLDYYWNIERKGYAFQKKKWEEPVGFEELWRQLEPLVNEVLQTQKEEN